MKKVILALSGIVLLAAAVVIVINAQDANKTTKKATTEVIATGKCCASSASCTAMNSTKSGCCSKSITCEAKSDTTKCKMANCDKSQSMSCCKGKEGSTTSVQSGCLSSCPMKSKALTK